MRCAGDGITVPGITIVLVIIPSIVIVARCAILIIIICVRMLLLDLSVRFIYAFISSVNIVGSAIGGVGVVAAAVKLETNIVVDVL